MMLTLDRTTLFYLSLSDSYQDLRDIDAGIHNRRLYSWAVDVPKGVGLGPSQAAAPRPSASRALTSTAVESSGRSQLNYVKVTDTKSIGIEEDDGIIELGGISDEDETAGPERDAAINSPPKAGRRANSSVSTNSFNTICLLIRTTVSR